MIYCDHNASSPLDPRVLEAMLPYLQHWHGNPSALHRQGRLTRSAIETAREQVAELAGCHPTQIIFTSGGTEANNLAISGMAAQSMKPGVMALATTEHAAVKAPMQALALEGWTLYPLEVDIGGMLLQSGLDQLPRETRLISVMLANNETGVIQDLQPLVAAARHLPQAVIHCDAVQAAGKTRLDFSAMDIQMMTLSAHKISGPKGAGALILDAKTALHPILYGGGQENNLRPGTENVPAIVGFGKAAELARQEQHPRTQHLLALRGQLESGLDQIPGCQRFASASPRIPNTVQFAIQGFDGATLVMLMDRANICLSSGSSCHSALSEPSPVLVAMGIPPDIARGAVRISLGYQNTSAEIEQLLLVLQQLTTTR